MRWISLPDELTLSHLLDVRNVGQPVRDSFVELSRQLGAGRPDSVLPAAGRVFGAAKGTRDRYCQALALLYQAEAYRCLERWEDALDAIRTALHWLELQVAPIARYNEAIAVYVEGIIHVTLGAKERALETFAYAQHVLRESERAWVYEHNGLRAADCRNVIGWIHDLVGLQDSLPSEGVTTVLPVYALVDVRHQNAGHQNAWVRTGAIAVEGARVILPGEALAHYLPPDLQPVRLSECVFPFLHPPSRYAAIRASGPKTAEGPTTGEDLVIVELTGSPLSAVGRATSRDSKEGEQPPWIAEVGVPRVLLRRRGEG
ncbi:MAG: hypothetical protein MUF84_04875 [Anaerolineae bacterium]|jgi:hypothetical protein|nr:hypothetical protein [Anaerolineae bacterium]